MAPKHRTSQPRHTDPAASLGLISLRQSDRLRQVEEEEGKQIEEKKAGTELQRLSAVA